MGSADRKEIFDYLRNVQKSEEVAARRSGMSIWVLWGALGFVGWKLIENLGQVIALPIVIQVSLSGILITQAVRWLIQPSGIPGAGREPRFMNLQMLSSLEAPTLEAVSLLLELAPAVAYAVLLGASMLAIVMGSMSFLALCFITWYQFRAGKSKFPNPIFNGGTKKISIPFTLIVAFACVVETVRVMKSLPHLDEIIMKSCALVIVCFWLIALLIETHKKTFDNAWASRTERDLLLGLIDNVEALRRIEQLHLGEKLSAMLDGYWHEIVEQQERVKALLLEAKETSSAGTTPDESMEPSVARRQSVESLMQSALGSLMSNHEEISTYLNAQLVAQTVVGGRDVTDAIQGALGKNNELHEKSASLEKEWGLVRSTFVQSEGA